MAEAIVGGYGSSPAGLALGGRTPSRGVFGGIALVLGIVALAIGGAHPIAEDYLDPIAQIALGAALIMFGAAVASNFVRLAASLEGETVAAPSAASGGALVGTTADVFIGGAVIVLGVLALLDIVPAALVPIQVILVGVGVILNSAASVRAISLEASVTGDTSLARRISDELVFATASARGMAGIAIGVLGIIALTGANELGTTLAAAIIGGAALLLDSATLSNRISGSRTVRHS